MHHAKENDFRCPRCGHLHEAHQDSCVACGSAMDRPSARTIEQHDQSTLLKSRKMQWVAAVIAFWISAGVFTVVFIFQQRVSLMLVSICLGLMILGIGLKIRYQLHLRKQQGRS